MKNMMIMAAAMFLSLPFASAQNDTSKVKSTGVILRKESKAHIKPYGFVRNYLNYDNRRMLTVCGGEYLMIPYDEDWNITESQAQLFGDDERFDRNAVPAAHLLALSSRFGVSIEGGQLGLWNLAGKLEGDFAGFGTNNTVLRLRLAYVTFHRKDGHDMSHELLVGQDWHPLSGSIMPDVLGMAAGAPFRPHSRTPQLRYTLTLLSNIGFTAAALWQFQYTSPGPDGESAAYANRSLVPELFMGLSYRTREVFTQLGLDYSNLLIHRETPILDASGNTLYSHLDKHRLQSWSPTLYFQYTPVSGLFALKMRTTLARNLAHLNMLSGYAWASDGAGQSAFIPMQASVSYLNISVGSRWRANLFMGYQKNLGLVDKDYHIAAAVPSDGLYMKKGIANINSIYRLAPSFSFNTKAFNIGLEYELTGVTYGQVASDGTVPNDDNLHPVLGHRVCLLVKYNF